MSWSSHWHPARNWPAVVLVGLLRPRVNGGHPPHVCELKPPPEPSSLPLRLDVVAVRSVEHLAVEITTSDPPAYPSSQVHLQPGRERAHPRERGHCARRTAQDQLYRHHPGSTSAGGFIHRPAAAAPAPRPGSAGRAGRERSRWTDTQRDPVDPRSHHQAGVEQLRRQPATQSLRTLCAVGNATRPHAHPAAQKSGGEDRLVWQA